MPKKVVASEHQLYQTYTQAEEEARSRSHYEHDPRLYYAYTGGDWNVYSALIWPHESATGTEAQEHKLDFLAQQMGLKPGMHILDIGCGWGGPLVYLCKTYGVTGVGITVSPKQRDAAEARATQYGVDAKFVLTHWENFQPEKPFDAIYSDEVIVHFADLLSCFRSCWQWLNMGGRMVHKELHFTHKAHSVFGRMGEMVHKIFDFSGHYRLLAEELQMVNDAGFELTAVTQIPFHHYLKTFDYWLNNLFLNRAEIKALVGESVYLEFRKYIKVCRYAFGRQGVSLDVITSTKIDPEKLIAEVLAADDASSRELNA